MGGLEVLVENPERARDGWSSEHTVIRVLAPDMPFIIDSPYFEYIAGGTLLVCSGLGLWWLADKVRDSVNANPRKDAEVNPAQSPHDDVPPQA